MANDMSNDHKNPKPDYAVGFRKPPKTTQYPKGKSGNPKGRPKAETISDLAPLVESIFAEPAKIRDGEQTRTVSKLEAVLRVQIGLALKCDPRAIRAIFNRAAKAGLFSKAPPKPFIELLEPDGEVGEVLRAYHAEKARQAIESVKTDPIDPDQDR